MISDDQSESDDTDNDQGADQKRVHAFDVDWRTVLASSVLSVRMVRANISYVAVNLPQSHPKSVGGTSVAIHVYVDDVDATFEKAITAGATTLRPVEDKFYGDRGGEFEDPFGHRWSIASHTED